MTYRELIGGQDVSIIFGRGVYALRCKVLSESVDGDGERLLTVEITDGSDTGRKAIVNKDRILYVKTRSK